MIESSGTVERINHGGQSGFIKEDGSTAVLEFMYLHIPNVKEFERYAFLKIN